MSAKTVVLLPLAERDIHHVLAHYRNEGGTVLAERWAQAVEAALRYVGAHATSGSPRYADMIGTPGLRFWKARRFPYLVFYVERATQVDVWRVLHAQRDIPQWLHEPQ
ncbi:MAG: type II toxin-antitoxin system RelE/ParE family toxin [Proteobacteria bacterium]|nr:type II toxin-antitoxin system RelE/ParE family toxin [Pseudomonadota bacterium]